MQVDRKNLLACIIFFFITTASVTLLGKSVVLFSPDDRPTDHLIKQFERAKIRIYAAVYMFTEKKIATALIEAKKRGVDVQIITDKATVAAPYGEAIFLKENGVTISMYKRPLMHHKFAIIDTIVWTGSFNWTAAANKKNQENVIYTDEQEVCDKFLAQFHRMCENVTYEFKRKERKKRGVEIAKRSHGRTRGARILPLDVSIMNLPSRPMRR